MSGGQNPKASQRRALNSYGNKATASKTHAKFDRLKREARDDLRSFSSNKSQRRCGVQPMYSVRVGMRQGRFRHDSTIVCKNRQSCPYCTTPALAGHRTTILAKAIHALDVGGFSIYGVLTLPKRHSSDLEYSYKVLLAQVARFRRKMKLIEEKYGITDSVRTLEETYSTLTHWHPHVNYVWFVREPMDEQTTVAFMAEAMAAWLSTAASGGIRGVGSQAQNFSTFTTSAAAKTLASYVSKHSFFIEDAPSPASDGEHYRLQPWEILQLARTRNAYWVRVWHQYEKSMKGQRRVIYYRNILKSQPASGVKE